MDRTDSPNDTSVDPPTGPATASAQEVVARTAARIVSLALTGETSAAARPAVRYAPPRPLVPRAYRMPHAVRPQAPATPVSDGVGPASAPPPGHSFAAAPPTVLSHRADVQLTVPVTAAVLPPAIAALAATEQAREPVLISLRPSQTIAVEPAHMTTAVSVPSIVPPQAAVAPSESNAHTQSLRFEPSPIAKSAPIPAALPRAAPQARVPDVVSTRRPWRGILTKVLRFAGLAVAGYFAVILALLVVYRFANPPMSSLMVQQKLTGGDVVQTWTDLENISPQIVRAVLLSEDGRFCQHRGVDLLEMQAAIERAGDGVPRGASTISMQVIKNLFLWPSKSYVRKAIEIPLTYAMELIWPKRRIMEVYLNIAEWGPGIFGVGSAAQYHFNKAASRLNEREAAQLAVSLPNPYSRDAGDPGPQTRRLASDIQTRMRNAYPSQTACVLGSRSAR